MHHLFTFVDNFPTSCRKLMKSQKLVLLNWRSGLTAGWKLNKWQAVGQVALALIIFALPFGGLLVLIGLKLLPSLMFSAPQPEVELSEARSGNPRLNDYIGTTSH